MPWIEGYRYRRTIKVTNNTAETADIVTLKLDVDLDSLAQAGKFNFDRMDIAIADILERELPLYIEKPVGKTTYEIFFIAPRICASATHRFYLFYGSDTKTAYISPGQVFKFFADFSDPTDMGKFAGDTHVVDINKSEKCLVIAYNGTTRLIVPQVDSGRVHYRIFFKFDAKQTPPKLFLYFRGASMDFTDTPDGLILELSLSETGYIKAYIKRGGNITDIGQVSYSFAKDTIYMLDVEILEDKLIVDINSQNVLNVDLSEKLSGICWGLTAVLEDAVIKVYKIYNYDVKIANYSVTIGAEETVNNVVSLSDTVKIFDEFTKQSVPAGYLRTILASVDITPILSKIKNMIISASTPEELLNALDEAKRMLDEYLKFNEPKLDVLHDPLAMEVFREAPLKKRLQFYAKKLTPYDREVLLIDHKDLMPDGKNVIDWSLNTYEFDLIPVRVVDIRVPGIDDIVKAFPLISMAHSLIAGTKFAVTVDTSSILDYIKQKVQIIDGKTLSDIEATAELMYHTLKSVLDALRAHAPNLLRIYREKTTEEKIELRVVESVTSVLYVVFVFLPLIAKWNDIYNGTYDPALDDATRQYIEAFIDELDKYENLAKNRIISIMNKYLSDQTPSNKVEELYFELFNKYTTVFGDKQTAVIKATIASVSAMSYLASLINDNPNVLIVLQAFEKVSKLNADEKDYLDTFIRTVLFFLPYHTYTFLTYLKVYHKLSIKDAIATFLKWAVSNKVIWLMSSVLQPEVFATFIYDEYLKPLLTNDQLNAIIQMYNSLKNASLFVAYVPTIGFLSGLHL